MEAFKIILFCYTLFSPLVTTSTAVNLITANQTVRDDVNTTIESPGGVFELGFFSPGSSKNRYVGIWYKKISIQTVVWVANREVPLADTKGILRIDVNGSLVLIDGNNSTIWSSNSSTSAMNVAQLLDTGNLVIKYENDSDPENYLWQSFDHPGNHHMPGMKIGRNLEKGLDRYMTSWKSADDPSPGIYTSGINLSGYPQLLVWKGEVVQFRYGPWDGIKFSGTSFSMPDPSFSSDFVFNQNEVYYKYEFRSSSTVMRGVLNLNGNSQLLTWMNQTQSWVTSLATQGDDCDRYAFCKANGKCNITQSQLGYDICECLEGFEPKNRERWKSGDWSSGCIRKTELDCGNGDGFMRYSGLKLPDTRQSRFNQNMKREECEKVCLKNCSCTAYSNMDIREGGVGCLLWFGDLIDIRDYRQDSPDLYLRMASSELEVNRSSRSKGGNRIKVIAVSVTLTVLLLLLGLFIWKKRKLKRKLREGILTINPENDPRNENEAGDLELPLFDFTIIVNATNNFSLNNKLGEGGFGPVYKGILDDRQEIAVKRLSKTSKQGLDEFKNEVSLIAKLQHRNLVRLLGCCISEGEMMLIYEYMPNKSLDSFLFDKELSKLLDWQKRYNIINGIARGLLYLHHDSRLRIIHRDLKTSNILLDHEMNPRISDFGLARSFGGSETEINTTRVVGTYGYMSPEYALDGIFSVKSDVYSFGVLVLEIISGMKIKGFYNPDPDINLLGHGWKLYQEGRLSELIDDTIVESCNQSEVFRAIQIGLLCVQSHPDDRPSMPFVVLMLSSDIELPQPNQPGLFVKRKKLDESGSSSSKPELSSSNKLTVTFLSPR